jgi:DNA polymerase III sliding clamp (beta) subunit (PCNA family)
MRPLPWNERYREPALPDLTVTIRPAHLDALVRRALPVVPSSDARPVLCNFLVQAGEAGISLWATDLALSVYAETALAKASGSGSFLVPARKLADILKTLPDGFAQNGELALTAGGPDAEGIRPVLVQATPSLKWELRVPDLKYVELPSLEGAQFTKVDRAALGAAIRAVRHAVGSDSTDLSYGCVTIALAGDEARVIGCDRARFQRAILGSFPFSCQIPAVGSPSAVDELLRTLDADPDQKFCEAAQTDSHLLFRCGLGVFATRKTTVAAPDATRLQRARMDNKQVMEVDRLALADAVRRVRITADPQTSAIGLVLSPGRLTVTSKDKFSNGSEEVLEAGWDAKDERLVVVHHRHLTEMLHAASSPTARFLLGPESKGRRSLLLLDDEKAGVSGIISPMSGSFLGY